EVQARLTWDDEDSTGARRLFLELSTDLTNPDSLWSFIPELYSPEVRKAKLLFAFTYTNAATFGNAATTGALDFVVSAMIELRLPALPSSTLFDNLRIHSGDAEGWIRMHFAAIDSSVTPQLSAQLQDACSIELHLPGL